MTVRRRVARWSTPTKALASVGVIGVSAAVAGLATYGSFTDRAATATTVQTGTLSVDVGTPGGVPHVIPVSTEGFVPGSALSRPLNLQNDGTVRLASVGLANTVTPVNALTTDKVNGLQYTLERCSQSWAAGGTAEQPTYSCAGTRSTLYAGPVISTAALPPSGSLTPGGEDHLLFTVSLPASAGTRNDLQGLSATLGLAFSAVQAPGGAR